MEIIRNMPEKEYRARPEISQSDFKNFREPTPAHALAAMKKKTEGDDEKDHLLVGRCLHALILENRTIFEVDPTCKTKKNPRQDGEPITLSPHYGDVVYGMHSGFLRNPVAVAMIEECFEREISLFWNGMKARLDGVRKAGIVDLKSARQGDLRNFSKAIEEHGYYIQAPHYQEAAMEADLPCENFDFVVCENESPFECVTYRLGVPSFELGCEELILLREKFFGCQKSGIYTGYSQETQIIDVPGWKFRKEKGEY